MGLATLAALFEQPVLRVIAELFLAKMTAPGQVLPQSTQHGLLLPCVHGFRLSRSSPRCSHFLARTPARSGRNGLHVTNMASVAAPVPLELLSFEGDSQGTRELSLLTTSADKATGLVHRYGTLARQNARRVSRSGNSSASAAVGAKIVDHTSSGSCNTARPARQKFAVTD